MTVPVQDPFSDPIIPPSTHPKVAGFRGRLIMITALKQETVPDGNNPGKFKERITANVTVVDGMGPIPMTAGNPPAPTGQYLEGPDFTGVWLEGQRIVEQLTTFVGKGQPVLGIIDTRNPGTNPAKGNPWGITAATPEQKAHAVNFLNSRTVGAAAAPQAAPPAQQFPPQYAQPQYQQQATPQAPAPGVASTPAPGQVPAANPFLQQAPAAAPAQQVNPFLTQQ